MVDFPCKKQAIRIKQVISFLKSTLRQCWHDYFQDILRTFGTKDIFNLCCFTTRAERATVSRFHAELLEAWNKITPFIKYVQVSSCTKWTKTDLAETAQFVFQPLRH